MNLKLCFVFVFLMTIAFFTASCRQLYHPQSTETATPAVQLECKTVEGENDYIVTILNADSEPDVRSGELSANLESPLKAGEYIIGITLGKNINVELPSEAIQSSSIIFDTCSTTHWIHVVVSDTNFKISKVH